jgi:hypothetical protein
MKKEIPLVNKKYVLEKFPGKGGWTYIQINEIKVVKRKYFGGVKVRGFIDKYELKDHNLFPMGKGILMMAVKAEIRKKIGKQEGDWVTLKLFYDEPEDNTNDEFLICLRDEPLAEKTFNKASKKEQQEIIDWIVAAKNEEMKVERIARALDILVQGKSLNH